MIFIRSEDFWSEYVFAVSKEKLKSICVEGGEIMEDNVLIFLFYHRTQEEN